ncbi:MAG: polyprenyl synthetase family protein [Patescibacteria group bacterium]|nr:polyprenyl synthetase family protein [Patescibacteria group bacterium]
MDFKKYLQSSAQQINKEMEEFFADWSQEVQSISSKLIDLNKAFIQASEGGKRLRGSLVKLGYELAGGEDSDKILKAAIAFEIFQTAILAHDDIIDLSPLRRGKPTLYHSLGGNHYGISQTICLGDIGFFLAERLISESDFPQNRKYQALNLFIQAMLETAMGQMLDIELPYQKESKEEVDALTVFRLKTARYTLVGPLHLGAILGGGNEKLLQDFSDLGENLGIAFQIQDDILGVFGNEGEIGKSITSDIEEGKNTLLMIHALKKADQKQKEVLTKYYGQGKIGDKELELIRQVFIDTGALEYSQKRAVQLAEKGKKVIGQMIIPEDKKDLLLEMADFLVKRNR